MASDETTRSTHAARDPKVQAARADASVLRLMLCPRIAKSAMKVSLVVGTVLNLINNGEQLWMHQTVNLWRVLMNFAVPFCVSAYSAARNEAQRVTGD